MRSSPAALLAVAVLGSALASGAARGDDAGPVRRYVAPAARQGVAVSGSATIPPGSLTGAVMVPVQGDLVDEPSEVFLVALGSSTTVTPADGVGQGTIVDPVLWEDGGEHQVPGYVTDLPSERAVAFADRDRTRPFAQNARRPFMFQQFMGPQVRGFSFLHDGAVDTVSHFFEAGVFLNLGPGLITPPLPV